jgi:hypothetical protein
MEMHVTNLKCPTKVKSNYSSSIVVNADLNHNHENDERKNERRNDYTTTKDALFPSIGLC